MQRDTLEYLFLQDSGKDRLFPSLDLKDRASVVQTSKVIYATLRNLLIAMQLKELQSNILYDQDIEKLECIIRSNPQVLSHVFAEVQIGLRRIFNCTPLQLAYLEGNRVICEVLVAAIKLHVYHAKDKIKNQIETYSKQFKDKHPFNFKPIFDAILSEPFANYDSENSKYLLSDNTIHAINKFRNDFDASQKQHNQNNFQFEWQSILTNIHIKLKELNAKKNEAFQFTKPILFLGMEVIISKLLEHVPKHIARDFCEGLSMKIKPHDEPFHFIQKDFQDALKQPSIIFNLDYTCLALSPSKFTYLSSFVRNAGSTNELPLSAIEMAFDSGIKLLTTKWTSNEEHWSRLFVDSHKRRFTQINVGEKNVDLRPFKIIKKN